MSERNIPVFVSGMYINDNGESVEIIEGGTECPHVKTSNEGTSYCELAEESVRRLEAQLAEAKKRAEKAELRFKVRCQQADERDSELSDHFTLLANAEKEARARIAELEAVQCEKCEASIEENSEVRLQVVELEARLAELEAQVAKTEARRVDAQTHRDVWQDKWENAIARAEAAEARIAAIDAALDDADAPDSTEAHALDKDEIIERIKLWRHAQGGIVEMFEAKLAEAEKRTEQFRELLRQSRHLYARSGKESVGLFEGWRRRVEDAIADDGRGRNER